MRTPGSRRTRRRTAGTASTKPSVVSKHGSRTSMTSRRSARSESFDALYEDACQAMADGFTKALVKANWAVSMSTHQTRIYSEVVAEQPKPVAYFLVDAMRFEMGVELSRAPAEDRRSQRPSRHRRAAEHHADWDGGAAAWRVRELQRRRAGRQARRAHRRCISSRPRSSEEVRGGARTETGRRRARRASEPPAVEARKEDRRRPGRRRSFAGDRPRRRGGLHVPGPAGHGQRHRQPGARRFASWRRPASSTQSYRRITATCSSPPIATSRCASTLREGMRSIFTAAAGLVAAARRRQAAFASRRRRSDTNRTSISCFRAVAASSRRAVTSPSTTEGRRFRSLSCPCSRSA